ncbi:facilitated trehalose transporter Tret1-like [Arctopsyche grandis]|uniref:facilitated trehalose transporter Tret1-like n=1 Tax=Arctopsyche grandis TaxID=121162 RepID=UPI00406D85F1
MDSSTNVVKQIILTLAASLAYLSIGLVRGYSSSALPSMDDTNPELLPSVEAHSWAGSIPPVGALFGSLVSGPLMQRAGRRMTILVSAPAWTAAWTCIAFAESLPILLIGRALSGFCVGLVLPATQVYVSECSSPGIRGRLGSVPALFMSAGILFSYILGYWLTWRTLAWCSAAAALIIFFFLYPLPESPIWLSTEGKHTDAERSLKWLKLPLTHESIQLRPQNNDPEKNKNQVETSMDKSLFTKEVFFSAGVLKPLGIGLALLAFQQISGIDAVIFFTVEIFKSSGSSLNDHLATIIVGVVQLASNSVSLLLVDRVGRKPLLMASGTITSIAMAAMGISFYIDLKQHPALGYLPLISLIVFMVGFSLGFGCIPFLLLGELFATKHRGSLSAIAGSFNLFTMFVVIKTYHSLQGLLTSAGTFWMYSLFCAVSVAFVALCVPETKGITLEEIEKRFQTPPSTSGSTIEAGKDNLGFQ